jgi:hypothetical protein
MLRFGGQIENQSEGFRCPVCAGEVERVHRNTLDRWASLFRTVHRFECLNAACGWHGLLGRDSDVEAVPRTSGGARLAWFVVGVATALGAVQGTRLYLRAQTAPITVPISPPATLQDAEAESKATPPGQDYNGKALPADDKRVTQNPSPLNLMQSCAWGVPGGNPYRGTVAQALSAAQLPPDIVREISHMAERGWDSGQVMISSAGIFTVDRRRGFGNTAKAMGFGNSLCFNMRVNFKPGHVEYATLYEATDRSGQTYSVMVPYVCQNVAVLGERYEQTEDCCTTPEPETWAIVLLGLAILGWMTWRRQRSRRQ